MTTIRRRLVASHVGLATGLMVLSGATISAAFRSERTEGARSGAERDAAVLAAHLRAQFDDAGRRDALLTQEVSQRRAVAVVDDSGDVVASHDAPWVARPQHVDPPPNLVDRALSGAEVSTVDRHRAAIVAAAPIVRSEVIIGAAVVVEDAPADRVWAGPVLLESGAAGVLTLVAAAIASAMAETVARPIREVTDEAHHLALGEDVPLPPVRPPSKFRELATLRAAFQRVRERTSSLQERTRRGESARAAALRLTSHQLRTPLSVIALRLDAITTGRIDERRRAAAIIEEQVSRLEALCDDLTSLARNVEAPMRTEPVDATAATRRAVASLLPLAHWSGVGIHVHAAEGGRPVVVDIAPSLLDAAVTNLVENSIKFAPRGSAVDVRVGVDGVDGADDRVTIDVVDQGPGIAPEERERVRRPWARGSSSGGTAGTGLGLSIVDEIMAAAGGELVLDDASSGGLRATLRLPMTRTEPVSAS